jgi:hypothetical protein
MKFDKNIPMLTNISKFIKNYFFYKLSSYLVGLIVITSFILSIIKSVYHTDPTHVSFMYHDAKQLLDGLALYKDIFVVYGVLTTITHSISLIIFGNYLISPSIITGALYSLSFLFFYKILLGFNIDKNYSAVTILIIFIIHPAILLPWANYIAYFFLILGLFFFTKKEKNYLFYLLAGFFLGLSILSRQTYFLSIFIFFIFFLIFDFPKYKKILVVFGYIFPLSIFLLYLFFNNLFYFWTLATFKWPAFVIVSQFHPGFDQYSNIFLKYFSLLIPLFSRLFFSLLNLDIKWFFYLCLLFINIIYIFLYFVLKKNQFYSKNNNKKLILISILSISFFSESVHIPDIIRLSTGAIIGAISATVIIYEFRLFFKRLFNNKFFFYFFILLAIIFIFIILSKAYKNYQYTFQLEKSFANPKVEVLRFQRYPDEISSFYENINYEIIKAQKKYNINYNFNFTNNSLLPSLCKNTKSFQISSHYGFNGIEGVSIFGHIYKYREDLNYNNVFFRNDIIVFQNVENKKEIFSDNFFIFKELAYPLHDKKKTILILLPKNVKQVD